MNLEMSRGLARERERANVHSRFETHARLDVSPDLLESKEQTLRALAHLFNSKVQLADAASGCPFERSK